MPPGKPGRFITPKVACGARYHNQMLRASLNFNDIVRCVLCRGIRTADQHDIASAVDELAAVELADHRFVDLASGEVDAGLDAGTVLLHSIAYTQQFGTAVCDSNSHSG